MKLPPDRITPGDRSVSFIDFVPIDRPDVDPDGALDDVRADRLDSDEYRRAL
jgi:hypothetical protein